MEAGDERAGPYVHEGRTYATNGHIALCLNEAGEGFPAPTERVLPLVKRIGEWVTDAAALDEWALPVFPVLVQCPKCEGRKNTAPDCAACGGDGEEEHVCSCGHGHTIDCRKCRGTGRGDINKPVSCLRCLGTGLVTRDDGAGRVALRGALVDAVYVDIVRRLPGSRVATDRLNGQNVIPFAFHGGMALVMPMRP
jgi:hypothetical protein